VKNIIISISLCFLVSVALFAQEIPRNKYIPLNSHLSFFEEMVKKSSIFTNSSSIMSLLFIFLSAYSFSQETVHPSDLQKLKEKTIKADAIVEGIITNVKGFKGDHGMVYTSATIRISKIFKGDISDSIIELIFAGGKMDNGEFDIIDHGFHIGKGEDGMFFLRENKTGNILQSSLKSFIPSNGSRGYIKFNHSISKPVINSDGSYNDGPFYHIANSRDGYFDDLKRDLYEPIIAITGTPAKVLGLNIFEQEALKKQQQK
jgi:hypothetical protein